MRQEQYVTEPEIAADVLWKAYLLGDIRPEVSIADIGAGPGSLGLGAALLGAGKVFLVDSDKEALDIAKMNLAHLKSEGLMVGKDKIVLRLIEVSSFNDKVEVVLQNPPFGIKKRHADRPFLNKAAEISTVVYSFHKSESVGFARGFMEGKGFRLTHIWDYELALKATQKYHIRRIKRIKVSCLRFKREEQE
ncbi:methyltransferase [Candidatus Woesearchaeota archaeon]|nr:methyltransferase [Candidatus Woesearchaeota archaeon]